jgi:hypothetical protein
MTTQPDSPRRTGHDRDALVSPDATRWNPVTAVVSEHTFGRGRSPRMTFMAWHVSQTTELGANEQGWYRRCTTRGCRIWAGPYPNVSDAKRDGMDHQHHAHDLPGSKVIA